MLNSKKVNILGTEYKIEFRDYKDDELFKKRGIQAYCNAPFEKTLIIGNTSSSDEWDLGSEIRNINAEKQLLRHEIVHAFLAESGLDCNSGCYSQAWALNEEMVDWFTIQGEKIYKAWCEAGAI